MIKTVLSTGNLNNKNFFISKGVFHKKYKNKYIIIKENEDFIRILNESASFIFDLIIKKNNFEQILKKLINIYSYDFSKLKKDLKDFINELIKDKIIYSD